METGIRRIDQPDKAIMTTPGYVQGDGGFRYEVGARARLAGGAHLSTESIFRTAAIGSLALRGQPVRCSGIVPGVTLVIATGNADLADHHHAERVADMLWTLFRPQLVDWLYDRHVVGPAIWTWSCHWGRRTRGHIEKCEAIGGDHISRCSHMGRILRCTSWRSLGRRLCGRIG